MTKSIATFFDLNVAPDAGIFEEVKHDRTSHSHADICIEVWLARGGIEV